MRLARHAWGDGSRLDLYSDVDQSAEAIADFAGAREADGYRRFCKRAESIYRTLRDSFHLRIEARPRRTGGAGWTFAPSRPHAAYRRSRRSGRALEDHFADPRLRQLVRALRHLLRLVAVPRACDADAGCSRRARGRLDRRRRHGAPRRGARRARESWGAELRFRQRVARDRRRERPRGGRGDRRGRTASRRTLSSGTADVAALADGSAGPEAARAVARNSGRRAVALGRHLGDDGAGRRISARAPQRVLFARLPVRIRRHLLGVLACRAGRQSTSARRIATRRRPLRSRAPRSASSASSTRRPVRRTAPSPMRRSSHARKHASECWSDSA